MLRLQHRSAQHVSHCYTTDTIYVGFRENQCLVIIKQDEYYLPRDWRRFSNRYPELEGKFPGIKISVVALWNWLCKLWKEENDRYKVPAPLPTYNGYHI